MIKEAIDKASRGIGLTAPETARAFEEIMSGSATGAQIAALAVALRMKGETVEEITAAAGVMRERSVHISAAGPGGGARGDSGIGDGAVVDTCGTGGSGVDTFNISTTAAFVVAGCGLKVAKHGNRSASGACGSADVLEALGVRIDVAPDLVQRCLLEAGIGFLYAPVFHGALKHAAGPRKEIGVRTIFNILGPLSNPANATCQLLGVYDGALTDTMARVLKGLGTRRAFVVHGADGLDEITITGRTRVSELRAGRVRSYYIKPEDMGVRRASLDEIEGGDSRGNAAIVQSVLKGERSPRRDIVLMNAAAALVAGGAAKDFRGGMTLASGSVDSGRALGKLMKLIELTNG
jgi:anthranilate phosphoribosyltransferase